MDDTGQASKPGKVGKAKREPNHRAMTLEVVLPPLEARTDRLFVQCMYCTYESNNYL